MNARMTPAPLPRTRITKSRAGHYTVSVRNALGTLVFIEDKLPTLEAAREAGRTAISEAANVVR
jgi:hypothetical protein